MSILIYIFICLAKFGCRVTLNSATVEGSGITIHQVWQYSGQKPVFWPLFSKIYFYVYNQTPGNIKDILPIKPINKTPANCSLVNEALNAYRK